MTPRPRTPRSFLVSLLFAAIAVPAHAGLDSQLSFDHAERPRTCSDLRVRSDTLTPARSEQRFTIPASVGTLALRPGDTGGVIAFGGPGPDFRVTACAFAFGETTSDAQSILARVDLRRDGGRLAAAGPNDSTWAVYFLVATPKGSALDLEAVNGPLSLDGVDGTFTVRGINSPVRLRNALGSIDVALIDGPVTVAGVTGSAQISTENGPVTIEGRGGSVRVATENGPIQLRLAGPWSGEGLEASSQNGPLSIELGATAPPDLEVTAGQHAPLRCTAAACEEAHRSWTDDQRTIAFGSSPFRVRAETVNGPVTIHSR